MVFFSEKADLFQVAVFQAEKGRDLTDKERGACLFEKEGFGMPREGKRLD